VSRLVQRMRLTYAFHIITVLYNSIHLGHSAKSAYAKLVTLPLQTKEGCASLNMVKVEFRGRCYVIPVS
jgi:hypothetical protein